MVPLMAETIIAMKVSQKSLLLAHLLVLPRVPLMALQLTRLMALMMALLTNYHLADLLVILEIALAPLASPTVGPTATQMVAQTDSRGATLKIHHDDPILTLK
jgi:hypothetical protein